MLSKTKKYIFLLIIISLLSPHITYALTENGELGRFLSYFSIFGLISTTGITLVSIGVAFLYITCKILYKYFFTTQTPNKNELGACYGLACIGFLLVTIGLLFFIKVFSPINLIQDTTSYFKNEMEIKENVKIIDVYNNGRNAGLFTVIKDENNNEYTSNLVTTSMLEDHIFEGDIYILYMLPKSKFIIKSKKIN